MRRVLRFALLLACLGLALSNTAYAQGRTGLRIGAGADISGGVAFGGQIDYTLPRGSNSFELGLAGFGGKFEEDLSSGIHNYHEETEILVVAAIANYLFRHDLEGGGPYFVAGIGVGGFSVSWREESPTDPSLGSPFGGGSFQEEDGTAAGMILNFGIGHRFNEQFDLRLQAPTFFISGGEERSDQVIPTFTVTLGIGF